MAGVKTEHPSYTDMLPTWKKMRDCAIGQKAVHKAGPLYLPKLKEQSEQDYQAYKGRATFYNAFYRTVTGLKGMLFRVDPSCDLDEALAEDVTLSGIQLNTFGQMVADEVLTVGRAGVMVDYPQAPAAATKADAVTLNLRPSLGLYKAESIINWKMGRVNNQYVLTMVVLKESAVINVDEFAIETDQKKTDRYRVLDLTPQGYRQRLFSSNEKEEDVLLEEFFPTMGSQTLDYIPFAFFGIDDSTPAVFDPPLVDLADLNLSHYKTTADLEHGAHFTGLPTPVVSGYTPDENQKLYIGSQAAWVFPQPDAKAEYLEFTGQGLDSLFKLLERKELQMSMIGLRMLEAQKRAAETAEKGRLDKQGEESVLSAFADVFSQAMTRCLNWLSEWNGGGPVVYQVNKDFSVIGIDAQTMLALSQLMAAGQISHQTMFDALKKGQLYESDAEFQDEEARIREQNPVLTGTEQF